jgi:hypothetical protein
MWRWVGGVVVAALLAAPTALGQTKEISMTMHAKGTFTVKMAPLTPAPAEGLTRFSIDKVISGDMVGTTKGEMFAGGDFSKGAAGYVAIEVVTGTLAGKKGSFALQHSATVDEAGQWMLVKVVPGSGTGELAGIAGTFTIKIEGGQHFWELAYTLPAK